MDIFRARNRRLHRERRQQGDADVGGDHLAQRLQAGRAEAGFLAGAGQFADFERLIAQAVAVFEQKQALVGEIAETQRFALGQFVIFGHGEQERFLEQELGMQLVVVNRQGEDHCVETAFAQLLEQGFGLLFDEQHFQAREARARLRHDVRQQIRAECGKDAEAQRARLGIDRAPRDRLDLFDLGQHAACARDDLLARFGQQHFARRALDESDAEFVFELLDLRRQRRLADEAGLRGTAEMLVFGE